MRAIAVHLFPSSAQPLQTLQPTHTVVVVFMVRLSVIIKQVLCLTVVGFLVSISVVLIQIVRMIPMFNLHQKYLEQHLFVLIVHLLDKLFQVNTKVDVILMCVVLIALPLP